jgi:hypothetical protein
MPRRFKNHNEVGPFFALLADTATVKLEAVATAAAEIGYREIRAVIGRSPPLEELQDATVAEKEMHGAAHPEAPLIDTGSLEASFETKVYPVAGGFIAGVGTPDPVMAYHEEGTEHIPPRPLVGEAAREAIPATLALFIRGGESIATGRPSTVPVVHVDHLTPFDRPPRSSRR